MWLLSTPLPEADRFDLRRHIRLGTTVTAAEFGDDAWTVSTDSGERLRARFVVMASGVLSTPKPPEIEDLEKFSGETYHTGRCRTRASTSPAGGSG